MSKGVLARVKDEFSFMRGNLLTLIVSWLFMYFTFSLIFPFESPYIKELGAPPVVIGLMGSVGALMLGLVRIPGAYIADKYGRRQITVTMTFVIAFSFLFFVFAPDWRFVLLGMIISNSSLIYQPALQAILADSVPPEKRGMGFAATNVIPNIPTIFAPAVAGFLVETQGLVPGMRIVYTVVFLCMLSAAFVRLFFLKETLREPQKIKLGEMKEAFAKSLGSIAEAWRSMSSSLKFLTAAFLISAFEDPMFRWFTALYVTGVIQVSNFDWGLVNVVSIAVTIVAGFPLGKLIDRIPRKKGVLLAYVIFMPSTALFILSRSFIQLLFVFILFAIGGCLIGPAYSAMQADMIPREKRGRIMGTIGTLNILATIPASAVAGILYDLGPQYPFAFSIAIGIVVSLIVLLAVKEPKTREI
ncbi:MAG: MFS transporter [Candidatus Bathyarchaeota archaeon]|nr:MAG: MFS transporter [Candidatus Bathyarchaeota archaeon]